VAQALPENLDAASRRTGLYPRSVSGPRTLRLVRPFCVACQPTVYTCLGGRQGGNPASVRGRAISANCPVACGHTRPDL